ncbi:MAG: AMP-binding protein, partial [Myxococcota bacterium]|nr:AMP-binding protein [Myxococcota bacterium]
GRPKGVRLTRDNFLWSAVGSAFHLGALPDDRWLACLPLFHVGGLSILLRSVLAGSAALVHERFDARAVSDALDRERVTLVSLTATTLHRLLDARGERPAPPALRCLLLGGGPCPPALLDRAAALGFPVAPTYGLTEAASQVATAPPGERALVPLLGTAVRVVDAAGRPLGPDRAGEIEVRGPTVTPGYVAPGAGSPLRDGWLRTGDVGEVDARGRLRVHDRRSDLIVSGGENVYPAEVEAALLDHPDLSEAGVVGRPDAEFGSRPVAWLVARGGAQRPDAEALRRFCRERLAGYKVPVAFHWAEALPRNASGKLLRRELPD